MDPVSLYILEKPEPFRSILLHLQLVIERTIPEVSLHYKELIEIDEDILKAILADAYKVRHKKFSR